MDRTKLRTLSDADIDFLAERTAEKLEERFVRNIDHHIGKGIRAFLMKVMIYLVIAAACYGFLKGLKP